VIRRKIEGSVAIAFDKLGISISRKSSPELVPRGEEYLLDKIERPILLPRSQCVIIRQAK
jgi:hypothetical protein